MRSLVVDHPAETRSTRRPDRGRPDHDDHQDARDDTRELRLDDLPTMT
jgi:hypothetical protein